MTTPAGHVSWNKIWVVVAAVIVPLVTMSVIVIRGGQQLIDRVDVVSVKVDKVDNRMDKLEEKLIAVSIRVDTISRRQEINNITNNYRLLLQQQQQSHRYVNPARLRTEYKATPTSIPVFTP